MNINQFMKPEQLEKNSFLWSQARLVLAAAALFLGARPVLLQIVRVPSLYGFTGSVLTISWIVSGVVSAYLGYRWWTAGKRVFGGKNQKDTVAFLVSVVSGLNLGWAGLASKNIGLSIASGRLVLLVAGVLYLVSAWHLDKRWKANGRRLF